MPCYVNSRLTGPRHPRVLRGGHLRRAVRVHRHLRLRRAVTLLDINNTVPASMYDKSIKGKYDYRLTETFMGFHCGNTCSNLLKNPHMGYQLIMKRDLEPDRAEPDITRGTMEGNIKAGDITFFRLQSTADTQLKAYIAQGEVRGCGLRELRRHRRVRHSGDGSLLPPCAGGQALSRTTARWPSAITARRCLRCSSIWASRT